MSAGRDTIGGGVMGEVTGFLTVGACAMTQEFLADGEFVEIVCESTTIAERASTCSRS